MEKISLITYPRCGSHFLHFCLTNSTNINIDKRHPFISLNDVFNNPVITVARDPFDSIVSYLSIRYLFDSTKIEEDFTQAIEYYIGSYEILIKNNSTWINYNNFDEINNVTKKIADIFGSEWTPLDDPKNEYIAFGKNNIPSWKFLSSKSRDTYEMLLNKLKDYDLSKAYEKYNEAISISVNI